MSAPPKGFNKVVQRVPVKVILDEASAAPIAERLRFGYSAVVSVRER
jgi:multidrug resistance efflux pump